MNKKYHVFCWFSMISSLAMAEESKSYCEKKCSPQQCAANPLQAAICEEDCPAYFKECYKAVPSNKKPDVNKAIHKIKQGLAAAQTH